MVATHDNHTCIYLLRMNIPNNCVCLLVDIQTFILTRIVFTIFDIDVSQCLAFIGIFLHTLPLQLERDPHQSGLMSTVITP